MSMTLSLALDVIDFEEYIDILEKNPNLILKSPGSSFEHYREIEFTNIYVSEFGALNKVRAEGKDTEHVNNLEESFSHGIDYSKMPPVVRWNPQKVNGKLYDYELVCGDHRIEALKHLGANKWVFGVYKFGVDDYIVTESIYLFQLTENDHEPAKPASQADVAKIGSMLVKEGFLQQDEPSIREFVDLVCKNKSKYLKGRIVSNILSASGHSPDVGTYTKDSAYAWINNNTDYSYAGTLDPVRNKFGWTVKEGYEDELLMNAIKKYGQGKRESYFVCHTKAPTATVSLKDKRERMVSSFQELEDNLLLVIGFYNKHQRFPWQIEGFLPQDHAVGEKNVVKM